MLDHAGDFSVAAGDDAVWKYNKLVRDLRTNDDSAPGLIPDDDRTKQLLRTFNRRRPI